MFMEKQLDQQPSIPATVPGASASPENPNFWVQEGTLGVARQAVIHLGDCPLCDEGRRNSGNDRWYGPFATVIEARDISDQLSDIAMRSECRCTRRVVTIDLPSIAMLNEPLFRRPEPVAPKAKARDKEQEAKKAAKPDQKKLKARKAKQTAAIRYGVIGTAAVLILSVSLFVFPALSVVEASSHPETSPFLLTNDSFVPLSDLKAECTVELQPAAVRLQDLHQQLAGKLGSKNQVAIPCFQASGGAIPHTTGTTVQVRVEYAVFGIHHVEQTFSFVAARTTQGFCRWVYKS